MTIFVPIFFFFFFFKPLSDGDAGNIECTCAELHWGWGWSKVWLLLYIFSSITHQPLPPYFGEDMVIFFSPT